MQTDTDRAANTGAGADRVYTICSDLLCIQPTGRQTDDDHNNSPFLTVSYPNQTKASNEFAIIGAPLLQQQQK